MAPDNFEGQEVPITGSDEPFGRPEAVPTSTIENIRGTNWSPDTYRAIVRVIIIFIASASYHASRKPISIFRSEMEAFMSGNKDKLRHLGKFTVEDVAFLNCMFLFPYAVGTYFFRKLGDIWDLRLLLAGGMVASGITVGLLGVGFFFNIRAVSFYWFVQLVAGVVQATGWPCVFAVTGYWLEGNRTGWKMGVWNAHTPVGNVIGSVLAVSLSRYGWGWSFLALGAIFALAGLLVFLFFTPYPRDLGFNSPTRSVEMVELASSSDMQGQREEDISNEEVEEIVQQQTEDISTEKVEEIVQQKPEDISTEEVEEIVQQQTEITGNIGFMEAWRIPGVKPFAISIFCMKLVSCKFMYWLPFYLSREVIGGVIMSVEKARYFSILFDVGGLIGGLAAGFLSDRDGSPTITAMFFIFSSCLSIPLYHFFGRASQLVNFTILMIAGSFISRSLPLITNPVSGDLGTHSSIRSNSRGARATVTAIMDGSGSFGAAFGPLLIRTGLILPTKEAFFWWIFFGALAACVAIALMCLLWFRTRSRQ